MDGLDTFLDMGGYAMWVWPGYGLAAAAMIGLLWFSRRTLKAREQAFAKLRRNRPEDAP